MTDVIEDKGIAIPGEGASPLTEVEQQAMDTGWTPEGKKTAKEWVEKESAYQKINRLEKAHDRDRESLEAMKGMIEGIRANEREKTIQELNVQKKTALENEDYDNVIAIDEKIAQERIVEVPKKNVAYEEWVEDNAWYNDDAELRQHAEILGAGLNAQGGKSPADIYKIITQEVKARFPEKFETKQRPNPVEGASKGRVAGGHTSLSDLAPFEQDIAKTLIKDGVFKNADDYMKAYSQ